MGPFYVIEIRPERMARGGEEERVRRVYRRDRREAPADDGNVAAPGSAWVRTRRERLVAEPRMVLPRPARI